MDLQELVDRSWAIRQAYHNLEVKYHDSKWTVEEDLLALSNDIGNFLRLVMTKRRSGSDFTMFKTFSNCVAEASELPPNLMTFIVTPKKL